MIGGSVYKSFGSTNTTVLSTVYSLLFVVTAESSNNVGMSSTNGSYITNTSGATVSIAGNVVMLSAGGTARYIEFVVGTSPDGINWTPSGDDFKETYYNHGARLTSKSLTYNTDVPNGHSVGILARVAAGGATCSINAFAHQVVNKNLTPAISVTCTKSTLGDRAVNLPPGWARFSMPTIESSQSIGATTSNGRITNTTGSPQIVEGFVVVAGRGAGLIGLTYGLLPAKNGVLLGSDRVFNPITTLSDRSRCCHFVWYSVELQDGDYMELWGRCTAFVAPLRTRSFQHTMRSIT